MSDAEYSDLIGSQIRPDRGEPLYCCMQTPRCWKVGRGPNQCSERVTQNGKQAERLDIPWSMSFDLHESILPREGEKVELRRWDAGQFSVIRGEVGTTNRKASLRAD